MIPLGLDVDEDAIILDAPASGDDAPPVLETPTASAMEEMWVPGQPLNLVDLPANIFPPVID